MGVSTDAAASRGSRDDDCKPLAVDMRWMLRRDVPEVMSIERRVFDDPWTEDELLFVLRNPNCNCIGMVVEHHFSVIGFIVYELLGSRIDILNFAVDPDLHRRTVASQMLSRMKEKLSNQRRNELTATVRERNLPAQLFLQSQGFVCLEVLREYYEKTGEDAYRMSFVLRKGESA